MIESLREKFIYNPHSIAKSFEEVSSDMVQTSTRNMIVKWYRSSHADLQVWLDREKSLIIRQQFSFLGLIVEWNHIQGVRTGYIQDSSDKATAAYHCQQISYDRSIQKESLGMAIEVIALTEAVVEKQQIISNYQLSPKLSRFQSFLLVMTHIFSKKKFNSK